MIGRTLSHYKVLDKLGAGGMGEVYLALDVKLHRQVALKVLPPDLAASSERLQRFEREARVIAALNHPHIVTLYSIEEVDGVRFFTMEVVKGKTLTQHIPLSGMDPSRFFELAIPLVDAVSAAHERQITHRDLKPANIMVSDDDRVKVLDFGLSKRRWQPTISSNPPPTDSEDSYSATRIEGSRSEGQPTSRKSRDLPADTSSLPEGEAPLTEAGRILGTGAYMSPEQVSGRPADPRSDVFSLGIILFEMLTGKRPFYGEGKSDLVAAMQSEESGPTDPGRRVPRRLAEIVARCLEMNPEHRYQSAKELRDQLTEFQKEREVAELLRSSAFLATGARELARSLRKPRFVAVALLVLTLAVASGFLVMKSTDSSTSEESSEAGVKSVAVLYFHNLTADATLDWLRLGLADMMATDLSRVPGLEVVSTSRIHRILEELGHTDDSLLDSELIQKVAAKAGVGLVLVGSFAKAGEIFQINFSLQDVESGEIVIADRREGPGETSVFAIVDELSLGIRRRFEAGTSSGEPKVQPGVAELVTPSMEAYRYYIEAKRMDQQAKYEEAASLYEKAIEVDPAFSLALVNLATFHKNRGHPERFRELTEQAVKHPERMPPELRCSVESNYYAAEWETYGQAVEVLLRCRDLYPKNLAMATRLAGLYLALERYEESIAEFERRNRLADPFIPAVVNQAIAHAAEGRFDRGYQILRGLVRDHPDEWYAHLGLGWHLANWGRFEESAAALARAEELRPGDVFIRNARWRLWILSEEWEKAKAEARGMAEMDDEYARWRGLVCLARTQLYRGRVTQALATLDRAATAYEEPGPFTANSRSWAAAVLLQTGRPSEALEQTAPARTEGARQWPELLATFYAALAHEALGESEEATRLQGFLREKGETYPNSVETRQLHHLAGLLALSRGEAPAALAELDQAEALLPPRGLPAWWYVLPDHVRLYSSLGDAALAAGDDERAARYFEKVAESTVEHVEFPVLYVRSFYFLAQIYERQGKTERARTLYRRFVDFWGEGDVDRERVEEARRKESSLMEVEK